MESWTMRLVIQFAAIGRAVEIIRVRALDFWNRLCLVSNVNVMELSQGKDHFMYGG